MNINKFKLGDSVKFVLGRHKGEKGIIIAVDTDDPITTYYIATSGGLKHWEEESFLEIIADNQLTYELLKPVSIKALEEAGACERELHRFTFLVLKYTAEKYNASLGYNERIGDSTYSLRKIDDLILPAAQCKGGIRFLLANGFIARKVERPDLKMDDPILVRLEREDRWVERYFKEWHKDGRMICWKDGTTSWSSSVVNNETTNWNYWKLPD